MSLDLGLDLDLDLDLELNLDFVCSRDGFATPASVWVPVEQLELLGSVLIAIPGTATCWGSKCRKLRNIAAMC